MDEELKKRLDSIDKKLDELGFDIFEIDKKIAHFF